MKGIILAAGYATRLYPLTLNTPKPLLEIGRKKMVEHIIHKMEEIEEIDEIHIVTNEKFHQHFLDWRKDFSSTANIVIHNDGTKTEEERLGAMGDAHYAIQKGNIDDDVVLAGGDNLFDFSLLAMHSLFKAKKAPVLAARDLEDPKKLTKKFGTVEIDETNKVIGFEEKPELPKSSLAATCVYIYSKEDIKELENYIEKQGFPDNPGEFFKHLMSIRETFAYSSKELWFDIGGHEELEEARNIFIEREQQNS